MRQRYIEIMEKALRAYTDEDIAAYLATVERDGLTEHGFPRLTANIGILLSFGKRTELAPIFVNMMELCTCQIPRVKAASDFSVREICCCLDALRQTTLFGTEQLAVWCERMKLLDPAQAYSEVATEETTPLSNWGAFNALSELARNNSLGVDTMAFIERQLATQLRAFSVSGLYKDPHNPMVYDLVVRLLLATLLQFGYAGKHQAAIQAVLDQSAAITARMQSVTGEIPFGGRSNQMVFNEMLMAGVMEYYARRYCQQGDRIQSSACKAAAVLAPRTTRQYRDRNLPAHVKDAYPAASGLGCETYAYFNKYMITVASFAYLAYLLCDDSLQPTLSVTERGGYTAVTDDEFHKLFLNAGGYFVEWELRADFEYDAHGMGRIHKTGCPSAGCLSVPFPPSGCLYGVERDNPRAMSLCCYAEVEGNTLYGSEPYAAYTVVSTASDQHRAQATLRCALSNRVQPLLDCRVSADGVELQLNGVENGGFMLPVFEYDGAVGTEIAEGKQTLCVGYEGHTCTYTFDGTVKGYEVYCNRNGRYRVYRVKTKRVKIEIM